MEKMWGNDQLGQENPFKHTIDTKPLCELQHVINPQRVMMIKLTKIK